MQDLKTQSDTPVDEAEQALAVLEAFKRLPPAKQEAQRADEQSDYSKAKKFVQRMVDALQKGERDHAEAQRREREAAMQRKEKAGQLRRAIDLTIVSLEQMDRAQVFAASEARHIAASDRFVPELCTTLGLPCEITTPDYTGAVAAWLRGEPSMLAATRAAERDALGALK